MALDGKVVVVTGSTRGIGRAIVESCARAGASVVVSSRNADSVQTAETELRAAGHQATGIVANVRKQEDLERLLHHAHDTWGHVDVWINNAGIAGGYRPLDAFSAEEIEAVVDTNLTAVLKACRLVIPYFIRHGGGVLINMTGKGGRGEPSPYMTTYAATKAAVTSLSASLAREYEDHRLSIHSASPGMVRTDMFEDIQVAPETEEVAETLPYVFNAIGVDLEDVGPFFAELADQEPGKETGKSYSLLRGWRLFSGIGRLMYYRMTGKMKGRY